MITSLLLTIDKTIIVFVVLLLFCHIQVKQKTVTLYLSHFNIITAMYQMLHEN